MGLFYRIKEMIKLFEVIEGDGENDCGKCIFDCCNKDESLADPCDGFDECVYFIESKK